MSQSITITRTTTATNTSYIVLNTGYLKTFPGGLKAVQLILGVICVTLLGLSSNYNHGNQRFFFEMALCFMIGTFLLLLSCLISLSTGGIISKTIYEVVYHGFAGVLLLISSLIFFSNLNHYSSNTHWAAASLGLVNSILYFISCFLANKSYRGI